MDVWGLRDCERVYFRDGYGALMLKKEQAGWGVSIFAPSSNPKICFGKLLVRNNAHPRSGMWVPISNLLIPDVIVR
jgi:hypothetical protein